MKLCFPHCFIMKSILMKQKVANRSSPKSFTVLNDDFSDHFFKGFEVTLKHFSEPHLFCLVLGL